MIDWEKVLFLLLNIRKKVVVFIAIKKNVLFTNYIKRIVLRVDIRGKGIGTRLMKFIEGKTVRDNLPNVR